MLECVRRAGIVVNEVDRDVGLLQSEMVVVVQGQQRVEGFLWFFVLLEFLLRVTEYFAGSLWANVLW